MAIKISPKGDDRLSDGTMDEKKSPTLRERGIGEPSRAGSEQGDAMRVGCHAGRDAAKLGGWIGRYR